jgi:probable phosphoglycerate mutase
MSQPLRLFFIRHAETAWSLTGQHTGRTDLPLTLHGESMARLLAAVLPGIPFEQVLTSPCLRTRTTCELAGLGAIARQDRQLLEWDYGAYEGLRTAEITVLHPGWDVWEDGCPGGETPAQAGTRADHLIAQLLRLSGNIALFSHGQFGRVLAARWIGLPVAQGRHLAIGPASIGVLGFEAAHPQRRVISLWNAGPAGPDLYGC